MAIAKKSEQRPYLQAVPSLGLSVQYGTESVPDDGRFHVVMAGAIVFAADSEKDALREYRRLRDRLLPPRIRSVDVRKILEREAAEQEARRFLADSSRAKRTKALRKGGKGGSGGVG